MVDPLSGYNSSYSNDTNGNIQESNHDAEAAINNTYQLSDRVEEYNKSRHSVCLEEDGKVDFGYKVSDSISSSCVYYIIISLFSTRCTSSYCKHDTNCMAINPRIPGASKWLKMANADLCKYNKLTECNLK